MENEKVDMLIGFLAGIVAFLIVTVFGLTTDCSDIKLEYIREAQALCKDNGGLRSIEHDYDATCNNGAEFDIKKAYVEDRRVK